jgi:hypothetical protein
MVDNFVKVVGALAELVHSFAWPIVVAWLVLKFAPVLRDFLTNISEGSLKGFGIEATAKRNAAEAIVDADISKVDLSKSQIQFSPGIGKSSALAALLTRAVSLSELNGKSILWVHDGTVDSPQEIRSLRSLGLAINTAPDVEIAKSIVATRDYDAIVIDWVPVFPEQRPFDQIEMLHKQKPQIPIILYGDGITPDLETEALKRGAFASTEKAFELLGLVISAIMQESQPAWPWNRPQIHRPQ